MHAIPQPYTCTAHLSPAYIAVPPLQVAFYPESSVSITLAADEPAAWSGDLLMVGIFQDDLDTSGTAASCLFCPPPLALVLTPCLEAPTQPE